MKNNKQICSDAPGIKRNVSRFIFMGDSQCDRTHRRTAANCRNWDDETGQKEKGPDAGAAGGSETELSYARWKTLLSAAEARAGQDAMLVLAGDIVNRGQSDTEWKCFQRVCSERLAEGKVISVPGNCDRRYYGALHFFSIEIGCMHLLMLDSNLMGSREDEVVDSIRGWIEEDLFQSIQPVKIAVMHHPMVTVGSSLDDSVRAATMRHTYLDTLRRGGVSFLLCGHQHLYCRRDLGGMTQVMGVSGTKYFDGPALSGMEAVHLFVSAATIFESDGSAVQMTTIDPEGHVLDTVMQSVSDRPGERTDPACDVPDRGGGRNEARIDAAFAAAAGQADEGHPSCRSERTMGVPLEIGPWRRVRIGHPLPEYKCMPAPSGRISICGVGLGQSKNLTPLQMQQLPHRTIWFSVYRKGRICQKKATGVLLEELLEYAGWTGEGDGLIISGQKGKVIAVELQELWTARRFSETGEDLGAAAPMLCRKEEGMQLITGQQTCRSYNGKEWIDDVTALEVIDLAVYCQ